MADKWCIYEIELAGPSEGNPFTEVQVSGRFYLGDRSIEADGFYDGGGLYRIRCMPDETGDPHQPSLWTLPKGGRWLVDVVDAWNMTITPADGEHPRGVVIHARLC